MKHLFGLRSIEEALAPGVGAVAFEGQMIDEPVVARARRRLARASSRAS